MLFSKLRAWFAHFALRVYRKVFQSFLCQQENYTKGVEVKLKEQVTIISTKEGAKIDYNLAVKKIADAGYSVEEAYHNPTGFKVEQVLLNTATKKNNN